MARSSPSVSGTAISRHVKFRLIKPYRGACRRDASWPVARGETGFDSERLSPVQGTALSSHGGFRASVRELLRRGLKLRNSSLRLLGISLRCRPVHLRLRSRLRIEQHYIGKERDAETGLDYFGDGSTLKFRIRCSWPSGCCSRHKIKSSGDISDMTTFVR